MTQRLYFSASSAGGKHAIKPSFLGYATRLSMANTSIGRKRPLTTLQAKLLVGPSDDPLEREADRVADEVMRIPDSALHRPTSRHPLSNPGASLLHRQEAEEEEEEKKEDEEENGLIQTKPLVQGRSSGSTNGSRVAPPIVHEALRSPGRPLDPAIRAFFEPRFGVDFSRVRIHDDAKAAEAARAVRAKAFAIGTDLVFRPNIYAPTSQEGLTTLAHELTHIVQQASGDNKTIQRRPGARRQNNKGKALYWGCDTTCTKYGFLDNTLRPASGQGQCCNQWPPFVEKTAISINKFDGVASCRPNNDLRRAYVTWKSNKISVLCVDAIPARSRHLIELSPGAARKLYGITAGPLKNRWVTVQYGKKYAIKDLDACYINRPDRRACNYSPKNPAEHQCVSRHKAINACKNKCRGRNWKACPW